MAPDSQTFIEKSRVKGKRKLHRVLETCTALYLSRKTDTIYPDLSKETNMTYPVGLAQKKLFHVISFYKSLIKDGVISEGGSGFARYEQLVERYNEMKWDKMMKKNHIIP